MFRRFFVAITLCGAASVAFAQADAAPPTRLRGTIEKVEPGSLTIQERSGEVITLAMRDNMPVTEVVPIALTDIQPGSFIGTAAMPGADGTLVALEVQVFPESMRGIGEGHRPWDLQPQSSMTNATVAELVATPTGRTLKLKYKDGEKTLIVPATVPVITYKPGDRTLVVPGAKVFVFAALRDGPPTALRLSAGRNGFAPPM